ncbi:PREDICTED: uncharacterized protein LOC109228196 [Nicotiana attenuata]|uniref:Senescence regulator n=1 Tax=Nicotiana attenuata TaxID=49451 RepID=A0A1J6IVS2_NICAT|nr:PREDICTED: uncharacterized protein LOC109228196 [Nicotiana attenuata]OIT01815.1 hypothetical protein A4A49_25868 [Nicotiana attenuata]
MAMRKSYLSLGGKERKSPMPCSASSLQFEFDESDIWNNTNSSDEILPQKSIPNSRFLKKSAKKSGGKAISAATSMPVNIPDWSKIIGNDYKNNCLRERNDNDDDDDDDNVDSRIPPHELLARTRVASFSMHEGMGRTLKGRDLSRVRNAIWKQTGFED